MLNKKFNKNIQKRPRINMQIRSSQVQLIDENGKQLGLSETSKAIQAAYEKGMDLVEVSAQSPAGFPIAKIMDFGKFMYQKEKKEKGAKKTVAQELKTVRIGLYTGEHDLLTKAKQADKFLKKGHPVRVEIFLRGREKAFRTDAREKIKQFPNFISESYIPEGDLKPSPSGFFLNIRPSK